MPKPKRNYINKYYKATFDSGTVNILSLNDEIVATLGGYFIEHGTVLNSRMPISADDRKLYLDSTESLKPGDNIEIRHEYLLARANFPLRHKCSILELHQDHVVIDSLPINPLLLDSQMTIATVRNTESINDFSLKSTKNNSSVWLLTGGSESVSVEITLIFDDNSSQITTKVARKFLKSTTVFCESIRWTNLPPLKEVYRKNRKVDQDFFQREYNVDRQGALFDNNDDRIFWIYGQTDATSITIQKQDSYFDVSSSSHFRDPPNDVTALISRDNTRIAMAKKKGPAAILREGTGVDVTATFASRMSLLGARLGWHRPVNKATELKVSFLDDTDNLWKTVHTQKFDENDRLFDEIKFDQGCSAKSIRLEFQPPVSEESRGILSFRDIDFLVSGENFELHVNLDNHLDHRYGRFMDPAKRTKSMGVHLMESRSSTKRGKNDKATTGFKFSVGQSPAHSFRIMHVPKAAQAMFIWTEHADKTCISSHRAVYFGSSAVTNAQSAVGGFVGNSIFVTKSVFYSNPDRIECSKSRPVPQAALLEDPEFEQFCYQIKDAGHEICVHAPQPRDAEYNDAFIGAKYIAERFKARTWIDHMARLVNCGMTGQGNDPESPYYMGDAWQRLGYKYFWHFACEDAAEERLGSTNVQQIRLGDWLHTPLFWRHPTEMGDFLSWPTARGPAIPESYNKSVIDEVIDEWGVFINHTYPAAHFDPPKVVYFAETSPGNFESAPTFESVLKDMAARIANGTAISCTVGTAMDYWLACEEVSITLNDEGDILLTNRNPFPIKDFSFAVKGKLAARSKHKIIKRKVGSDSICSFNFPAQATVKISQDNKGNILLVNDKTNH